MDSSPDLQRQGELVVCVPGSAWPERCVVCNGPTGGRTLRTTVSAHRIPLFLIILLTPFLYYLFVFLTRRRARLIVGICAEHDRQRRRDRLFGWLLTAGLGALFGACFTCGIEVLIVAVGVWLVGMVFAVRLIARAHRIVWAREISPERLELVVGAPFLESLPVADGTVDGAIADR